MKKTELKLILLVPVVLSILGLIELYSINQSFFYRQLMSMILAGTTFFILYITPEDYLENLAYVFFGLSVLLLIFVLGLPSSGPKRWIPLGGFKFQPSEIEKFATILLLAKLFSSKKTRSTFWKGVAFTFMPFALTLVEPDLGTSAVFVFIGFAMAYLAGFDTEPLFLAVIILISAILSFVPIAYIIFLVITVVTARLLKYSMSFTFVMVFLSIIIALFTPVIWQNGLHEYQRKRIIAFFQPEKFEKDIGWQVVQAHIALGSGGFWGKGFRRGTQKGLSFLPAAHTDFIFSSIGEEFGFFVCSIIVLLFLWWIVESLIVSSRLKTEFGRLMAYGIVLSVYFHAFVNIGANIGILPVVGLPLPFITYGGSHLITEAAMLGALYRQIRKNFDIKLI